MSKSTMMRCPQAKSDWTPCFLRDGEVVEVEVYGKSCCVGCERTFADLREEMLKAKEAKEGA